jgi:polyribonucleotide nucleotidyltransferase
MRRQIVEDGVRVDGRKLDEVRPVSCKVGLLPQRVHGSALFNRGLTQVLSTATLGTPGDAQKLDDLNPKKITRYLHHYNFPPYSVGETKPMRSPGRREIGPRCFSRTRYSPRLTPPRRPSLRPSGRIGGAFFQWFDLDGFGLWVYPRLDGCWRTPDQAGEWRGNGSD